MPEPSQGAYGRFRVSSCSITQNECVVAVVVLVVVVVEEEVVVAV